MRDRHARGLRGPLSTPNPFTGTALRRSPSKMAIFTKAVQKSVARVLRTAPAALTGVDVGIADVPTVSAWHIGNVPLASATSATAAESARIVLYRRPHELRAEGGLDELVFRTLVQQLSELTGIPVDEIAPELED